MMVESRVEQEQEVIVRSPEEALIHLRENGVKKLIDFSSNDSINSKPKWLDEVRFAKAKDAINKYQMGVDFSSFTGLLLILQIPDALEPLLSTGKSKDIPSLFDRYLSTIIHVRSWYTDDIFDPSTKGYKSIRQVRAMHRNVQRIMNEKFTVKDHYGRTRAWMTQYDVAITQFSFLGLALIHPEKCGLIAATEEELELIAYYWRVLGHMMGLELEFNTFQYDRYEDIHKFLTLMFDQEFKSKLNRENCEIGLAMTQGICKGLKNFLPLITFNSLAHWWSDVVCFNGYQPQAPSSKEKVLLKINQLSFKTLFKNETFMRVTTKLHIIRFNALLKRREKIYQQLVDKYAVQENYTYYSDRCDYFNQNISPSDDMKRCPFGYDADLASPIDKQNAPLVK